MGAEGMHVFWKHTCSMLPLYTNKHMQSQTFSGPELRFRRQGSELASRIHPKHQDFTIEL